MLGAGGVTEEPALGLVAWGGSSRVLQTPCARADRDAAIGVVTPVRPAWGRDPVALELAARPRQARPPAVRCSAHACGSRRGRAACGHGNAYIRVFRSCCAVYMCSHSTRAACSEILCRRQLQGMRCYCHGHALLLPACMLHCAGQADVGQERLEDRIRKRRSTMASWSVPIVAPADPPQSVSSQSPLLPRATLN